MQQPEPDRNSDERPLEGAQPAGAVFFWCLALILALAPLYKAGNRALPLLLLELAAIGFILVVVAVHRAPIALPRALLVAIGVALAYPMLQMVPLAPAIWRILPGHAEYAAVVDRFASDGAGDLWRATSVVPSATEYGLLALLPPLACLLAAMRLAPSQVARLLLAMVGVAGAEALLGLLQVAPASSGLLYFDIEEPGQRVAIGTFINKNHLAAMLAMMPPVIVGLLAYNIRRERQRMSRPAKPVTGEGLARRTLLLVVALTILVCLILTRSRAGIAAALVGLACAGVVLAGARAARVDSGRTGAGTWIVAAMLVITALVGVGIGVEPLLRSLEPGMLIEGAGFRLGLYQGAWRAAIEFLPFGSGLSTFGYVYPRFQTHLGYSIDYAHNDYLQALVELGLAAPIVVGLSIWAYAARMRALIGAKPGSFVLLQIGAGLGMLPMLLHSAFDFALHMPANAMWFAALAGVLFHPGVDARRSNAGPTRKRRTRKFLEPPGLVTPPAAKAEPRPS